jgi:CheY-like chemotaxis protein
LKRPASPEDLDKAFTRIEERLFRRVKHLLVAEDHRDQQQAIVELLEGRDIEISVARSGEEAYELLQNTSFDCMILDLDLKGAMSGFDVLEHMDAEEHLSHPSVVVYTGKELSAEDEARLQKYTESIVIKGARSPERLLDEVTLFLHRVESDLPVRQRRMLRELHRRESPLADKTVLIVDDDMRNVFALTHILEEHGVRVVVAKNGREGVERLQDNPDTDLVLMDIMMPVMDGHEAMAAIRSDKRFARLPIIALTAKAMKGDREKCITSGANDYLPKPVDVDRLLSMLRIWLHS